MRYVINVAAQAGRTFLLLFLPLLLLLVLQLYVPSRDAVIYACGVIAGQDSILDEKRERPVCVEHRRRAESAGFTPFKIGP